MLSFILADFYRILKKKSLYIFLSINAVLFAIIMFITNNQNLGLDEYLMGMHIITSLIPVIVGTFVFSIVYIDDLNAKSVQGAIGYGKSRTEIVIVKYLDAIILMAVFSLIMVGVLSGTPYLLGLKMTSEAFQLISKLVVHQLLVVAVYFAIASIVVYYIQKAAGSITAFILLITSTINALLGLLFTQKFVVDLIGNITQYFPKAKLDAFGLWVNTNEGDLTNILLWILGYIVVSLTISIVVFKRKELEF